MRSLLLIASLAVCGSSMAAPITYETRAKLLPRILKDISAQSGESYKVDTRFEKEVLQVRLKGVDSEEFHQKLARVLGGTWVRAADGDYRLTRSDEQTREYGAKEREDIAQLWKQEGEPSFLDMAPGVQPADTDAPPPDQEEQRRQQLAQAMGKARQDISNAMEKELEKLDLSRMAIYERWGFASNPRGRQNRAFSSLKPLIEAYARAAAAASAAKPPIVGVRATIQRSSVFFFTIEMEMVYATAEGMTETIGSRYLGSSMPVGFRPRDPDEGDSLPKLNNPEKMVPVPKELAAFQRISSQMDANAFPAAGGFEEAFKFLMDPLNADPLGTMPAEVMLMAAEDLGKPNIVAVLPDDSIGSFLNGSSAAKSLKQSLKEVVTDTDFLLSTDGTFLLLEPNQKASFNLGRLDRIALQKVMDSKDKQGGHSIEQQAEFFGTYPELSQGMFMIYGLLAQVGASPMLFGPGNNAAHAYRFYGSLGAQNQAILRQGATINVSRLSPTQRSLFERMAPKITVLTDAPNIDQSEMNWLGAAGNVLSRQGTDSGTVDMLELTSADVSRMEVQGQALSEPALSLAGSSNLLSLYGPLSPRTFAQFDMMASMQEENPDMQGSGMEMFKLPESFRIGRTDVLSMRVLAGGDAGVQVYLRSSMVPPNAPLVKREQFPPELKAAIDKAQKQMRDMLTNGADPGVID